MKQALIIIDVQNDYFEGGKSELCNPLVALNNIEKVLKLFRDNHLLIIHVQHINTREGATFFLPDTNGVLIHQNLAPKDTEQVVVKHAPNSFYGTNLNEILKENQITDVVICGMMSHMCIDTTTRACRDYGLNVILLDDACATKNLVYNGKTISAETVHDVFMASISGMFAKVINTEELKI